MATSRRDNARVQAGEVRNAKRNQRINASTTGEAQRRRIVEMLHAGQKHTLDFRRAGIMQSQTRIFELRSQGYDIPTIGRVTAHDDQGYPHRGVALYELVAAPKDKACTTGDMFADAGMA